MENSAIHDLENGADEAVLEALLEDAKKGPGEAALEALLTEAGQHSSEKEGISKDAARKQERQAMRERKLAREARQAASVEAKRAQKSGRADVRQARAQKKASDSVKAQMLIVHADMTQRSVLEMSFISEGYDVTIFETGKEALNYLKTNVPDIMLLDADMEKLTGMDICFRIRKIKRFEDVPVIIMTESVDDRTETMVKMCHANDFFPKTSKNIELKAKVRKLIDNNDIEKLTRVDVE